MKETPLLEVKNLQKSFTVKKDSSVHPSDFVPWMESPSRSIKARPSVWLAKAVAANRPPAAW